MELKKAVEKLWTLAPSDRVKYVSYAKTIKEGERRYIFHVRIFLVYWSDFDLKGDVSEVLGVSKGDVVILNCGSIGDDMFFSFWIDNDEIK